MLLSGEAFICYFTSLENHLLFTIIDNEELPHQIFISRDLNSETLITNEKRLYAINKETVDQRESFYSCK